MPSTSDPLDVPQSFSEAMATLPSQNPSESSHQAQRASPLATNIHVATHFAGWRISSCYKSALRCASPSAFESGIFELLGQLYPARLLFFAVEKK